MFVPIKGEKHGKAEYRICRAVGDYALQIPVSTQPSDKTVCTGDRVSLWASIGKTQRFIAASNLTVTAAHRYQTVNLMALETRTFVSRHAAEGAPGVRIPQTYLDELAPWMEAYEKNAYAPDEDWDEDGADNFTEYLSGTNPFDPSDKLTIVAFRAVPASSAAGFRLDGSLMSLSFESVGGHTYSVLATPELARPQWATKSFSTAADGAKAQTKFTAAGSETDADLVTLYLLPTAEANQEFLKVKPE